MSEQFIEQISEFIDDEMSAEECEFFVRRIQRDDEARGRYLRYQMIGTMLRGEHALLTSALSGRLAAAAMNASPNPAPAQVRHPRIARVAAGLGIAASVALVAVVGLALVEPEAPGDTAAVAAMPDENIDDIARYTPVGSLETTQLAGAPTPVTGIQYLFHHTNYTSGLSRTIMHSSVVAGSEQDMASEVDTR